MLHSDPAKTAILLHGGPGLSGYFGSLRTFLEKSSHVVEYTQTGHTISALTAELETHFQAAIQRDGEPPVLVGHSWGAVLALFYASNRAHRKKLLPRKIILLGCAPLQLRTKTQFRENLASRFSPVTREALARLDERYDETTDEDERTRLRMENLNLITPFYNVDPESTRSLSHSTWDYAAFEAVWEDLNLRLENGTIPSILERISVPVVSFHGASDPIPVGPTHAFLANHLQEFRAYSYLGAGHFIWVEPRIGERFLRDLGNEILRK